MPNPINVNPEKFKVDTVLYDYEYFSIVFGTWTPTKTKEIAMRWNGDNSGDSGYPKVFGHPQWFLISEHVARSILSGLLLNPNITLIQYNDIIEALKNF